MIFPAEQYKAARLNTTDVAVLFAVSRVTASNWLRSCGVHSALQDKVTAYTRALADAVAAGRLPWPRPEFGTYTAAQRASLTKQIVTQYAKG